MNNEYLPGYLSAQAVWSSGAGDFLEEEFGVQSQFDREFALAHAAAPSGGAAKKSLQICGVGGESQKRPALPTTKKPNGKSQIKAVILKRRK
jgi:hypothetical protein